MAGILNNKERMIDFLITLQGRQQMADGRMRIEFASLTDRHTFYAATGSHAPDVAEDATQRIYFETSHRPQDVIVPELIAGHSMQPFRTNDFIISGRKIASGTFKTGAVTNTNILSSSEIPKTSTPLLRSLFENFKNQKILATSDAFSDTTEFSPTAHTASFVITDSELDFQSQHTEIIDLESSPNLFTSKRFAHLPNFKYLPPVNVIRPNEDEPVPLGKYPELSSGESFETKEALDNYLNSLQSLEFSFSDTSRDNNLVCQMFEFTTDEIEKLSIIDYGEFADNDPESPGSHVYFIGRMRKDKNGAQTFLNLFTVVFD